MRDGFLAHLVPAKLSGESAFMEDKHAIAHAEDLFEIARDHEDGGAVGRQSIHDPVDFALGAHVDAPRRLIEDNGPGLPGQPFAHDDFLLIPAAQELHALTQTRRANVQAIARLARERGFPPRGDDLKALQSIEVWQSDVVLDAVFQHQAMVTAVLGNEREPGGDRVPGIFDPGSLAVEQDLARDYPADAEDCFRQLRAPAPTRPAIPTISPARSAKETG